MKIEFQFWVPPMGSVVGHWIGSNWFLFTIITVLENENCRFNFKTRNPTKKISVYIYPPRGSALALSRWSSIDLFFQLLFSSVSGNWGFNLESVILRECWPFTFIMRMGGRMVMISFLEFIFFSSMLTSKMRGFQILCKNCIRFLYQILWSL